VVQFIVGFRQEDKTNGHGCTVRREGMDFRAQSHPIFRFSAYESGTARFYLPSRQLFRNAKHHRE
jgi:hypothetical protein